MKTAIRLLAVGVFALILQGCFVVFIPGSVIDAASDGITGAEGGNCVSERAKVGDFVTVAGVGAGKVVSLSGTSVRCKNPAMPIRAKLAFDESTQAVEKTIPKLDATCNAQCVSGGNDKATCDYRCLR